MSETENPDSGTPLSQVSADDLHRVWQLIQTVNAVKPDSQGESTGISAQLISQHCEPDANVDSVFFRATLLQHLFRSGLLDRWRNKEGLTKTVFEVAASFPIDNGVQGFDPATFVERLRSAEQ